MQCQICNKNEATIHLTEISDGVRNETHICEQCAIEQGIAVKSQMPINELLNNLLISQPSEEEIFSPLEKEVSCPHCGFTLERFRKEAVLGCPADYEVFEQFLLPLIEKAQNGKTIHCGKVPSKVGVELKSKIDLSITKKQLDEAVAAEDYELAAKLRDKIKQLEQ